jgi:hypothetical protein
MIEVPIASLAPAHGPKTPDSCPQCGHKHSPARGCGRHRKKQLYCKRGHLLAGDNLYLWGAGWRRCQACRQVHETSRRRRLNGF